MFCYNGSILKASNKTELQNWIMCCRDIKHYKKIDKNNSSIKKIINMFPNYNKTYIQGRLTYFYRVNFDDLEKFNMKIKFLIENNIEKIEKILQ